MMSKRIGYIDAMRGFTMILVVYSHICTFCMGDSNMAFNDVFFLFRLPCFFFISGWLFKVTDPVWPIIKKKFMVQIVPTLFFLFLLAPPPAYFHQFGAFKGGYWFTFALFVYFMLYIGCYLLFRRYQGIKADVIMLLVALAISMSAYWYDINYSRLSSMPTWQKDILGFLSFVTWRYYLFFILGTLARKHFHHFLQFTSNVKLVAIVVAFFVISMIPQSDIFIREYLRFAIGGILGMTMVFAAFRFLYTYSRLSPLEYVGTRTLDIYLLHYFFLPRFLMAYSPLLHAYNSSIQFVVIMVIALIVLLISLLTSYIICFSPFLGHYLFGAKSDTNK